MRIVHKTTMNAAEEPVKPGPDKPESDKRALVAELSELLGVGAQMAHALAHSHSPNWQKDMIDRYGERLSARERGDLWRRVRPYDPDAEEDFEKDEQQWR